MIDKALKKYLNQMLCDSKRSVLRESDCTRQIHAQGLRENAQRKSVHCMILRVVCLGFAWGCAKQIRALLGFAQGLRGICAGLRKANPCIA